MLRGSVIVIGLACFAGGLIAMLFGIFPPAWVALAWGILILLGTVWERVIYKPVEAGTPGAGWVATDERFVDDRTGKPVRVWLQPTTGERRYISD